MPSPRKSAVTVGILFIVVGLVLFLSMYAPLQVSGVILGVFGLGILVYSSCQAMKSEHVTVPGHFLLHPRTGTRYSPHQAMAIQRRLDRLRRAAEEEQHQVSTVSPASLPQHSSQQSLPQTPPPWEMEPPPSYETVMKGSQSPVQNL